MKATCRSTARPHRALPLPTGGARTCARSTAPTRLPRAVVAAGKLVRLAMLRSRASGFQVVAAVDEMLRQGIEQSRRWWAAASTAQAADCRDPAAPGRTCSADPRFRVRRTAPRCNSRWRGRTGNRR